VAAALRPFLRETLRRGRGWDPLVTANTWYPFGTDVSAATVVDELAAHARLGAELYVLDAGWYPGRGEHWSFSSGLGLWQVDEERFPDGLAPLGDEARNLGMRFGVWVEPERVDLDTVGRAGLAQERWMATRNGDYDPGSAPEDTHAAQICLADAEARQWVWDQLVRFIESVRPDYLKWDNNFWVNCNRTGHGHGPGDGNLRHVQALYALLGALRERYPHLVVENVSGGGNRVDLGMARLTDVAWMDDRTSHAAYVRHNLEGLSAVFPPAYLLSFVLDHADEPLVDAPDLGLYMRSRMPGTLGLSVRADGLDDETLDLLAAEIGVYKHVRDILRNGTAALLTAQTRTGGGDGWDALQATSADQPVSVVFAFQQQDGAGDAVVRPLRLQPDQLYRVRTVDAGDIGVASGSDLMTHGLGLHEGRSAAHIIILEPAAAGVRGKRD
jgi:alpha-galactosidase